MNVKKSLSGCLLLGCILAARGQAQTVTLPATADTYLKSGTSNQNQGSEPFLRIQSSGNNRSLVRFDPAAITAAVGQGSLVGARLELYIQNNSNNWGSAGRTMDAHRLTAPWTEAGATWKCGVDANPGNLLADCSPQWSGGQFEEEPSDTVLHTNGLTGWVSFDITADVRAFLSGTPNDGWLIKKTEEGQSGQVDYTSRQGGAGRAPRLVLVVESAAFDEVPPSLRITAPDQKVVVNDATPEIRIEYTDGGSGVNPSSLQVFVDATNITGNCTAGATSAICEPPRLSAGTQAVQVTLADHAGNESQASVAFELLIGSGLHTLTFPSVADTYLRQGTPNQNQGSESLLHVQGLGRNRALVRFDQEAILSALAGATLRSAELELYVQANGDNWGANGRPVDIHRLTEAWTESGATWNCANDSNPTNPLVNCLPPWNGGTFVSAPTASVLHTNGLRGWIRFVVTSDMAAFLTGTANHGWLLKKADEWRSGRVDYTARTGAAAQAPRLVVTFETPVTDTTSPTIAITSPADGSFVASATPTITATYSDTESGIEPASVRLLLDGIDRTAEAQVTAEGVTWTSAQPLTDGLHEVIVSVSDLAGNLNQAQRELSIDTAPPALTIVAPPDELLADEPVVEVVVLFGDTTSGIDAASFALTVDGVAIQASCTLTEEVATCRTPPLASGEPLIAAEVRDRAGHRTGTSKRLRFTLDRNPPILAVLAPADGSSVNSSVITVYGTATDDSRVISVEVNGAPAALAAERFSLEVPLQPGPNALLVVATDAMGRQSELLSQVRLDTAPPVIRVDSPRAGAMSNFAVVRLRGEVVDESEIASLSVAGSPVSVTAGRFETDVALVEGPNALDLRAVDTAGNVAMHTLEIARFTLPEVLITAPEDLSFIPQTTVDVAGTVSDPGAVVSVNGIPAAVSGTGFVAQGVPLIEGGNVLTVTARNSQGHIATDHIQVVRDTTAPRLAVHSPQEGREIFEPTVTVAGMVNDIVAGTVNLTEATVTVNGVVAEVGNRSFLAPSVPLVPGENVLAVEAVDESGNVGRATVRVTFQEAAEARVRKIAGDLQSGAVGTLLAQPLRVRLLDAAGLPVAGKPVLFKVRGNDGRLADGKRQVAVLSDASGHAATPFQLGSQSGAGNQAVEASAVGFAGPAVFRATALPGGAALIVVDSGDHQVGVAGQTLPRPLVAVVTDNGFNRLPGIAVRFIVVKGEGHFEDGSRETTVTTDSDGRAILNFRLDAAEGASNNVVEARIASLPDSPVVGFTASGWAAGNPSETAIQGIVLDNTNQPILGVTLRIKGYPHTARTDAAGVFRISGAPVGTLYLIVDGSTAERPGSWPDLEFVVSTIAGRDNDVGMPIYLLPLDLANGISIDETRGGILRLPEVPGFALEVAPGSVTFPSGSRSGVVSVTVVHADKVPMVPNFGQQPRLIVTIQPAGARFEPPARLTLPNLEGLAPGAVTELYSFDHDLGHFVSIGPATVSEDGMVITANPGVGIVKAGWHCGGTPDFTGSSEDCPMCHSCILNWCRADDAQPCSLDAPCRTNSRCQGGKCTGDDVTVTSIGGACFGEVGEPVTLVAVSNAPDRLEWQAAPDASPEEGSGGEFTTVFTTEGTKSITVGCPTGDLKGKSLRVLPSCTSGLPDIHWKKVDTTVGCFGATGPIQVVSRPKPCARSGKICSQLESMQIDYYREVPTACGIDVPSADAPAVTQAIADGTCDQLIADLIPQPENSDLNGAPKRDRYWVRWITEEHEQFHEDNHLRALVKEEFVPGVLALLQDDRWCGTGCGANPDFSELQAEIARIWQESVSNTWNDRAARRTREQEAYADDAPKYRRLIAEIHARCTPPGGNP